MIHIMATELLYMSPGCFFAHKLSTSQSARRPLQGIASTTSRPSQMVRCSADQRLSANYQPSSWSYDFLQSLEANYHVETYKEKVEKLEKEVRHIINKEDASLMTTLELIDDIQRLGLGYRFEEDIRKALERISSLEGFDSGIEKSLHAAALGFRLLRQHGFNYVSQDIFKIIKDQNGSIKESLSKDVKGMLSLYEASHLAFQGESLWDEAREFTRTHLNDLIRSDDLSKDVAEEIRHALELPLHQRMNRLEARRYIEGYAKRSDANRVLLEFAKWDFNMVQSTLQNDLKDLSRWWKDVGLTNKLSFARDRLVESFFWSVGMAFEPQYSRLREELTKVFAFVTVIDDVYDVYGTVDELELFTDAIERWDVQAVQNLPDYMRICFLALYNTVNDLVYETLKERDEYILPYITKAWADMCKAFLQEKKWTQNKETPSFEDYLENGWMSSSGGVFLVNSYLLVSQDITKQGLESLENYHNLLRWPSIIFRLTNDLATSSAELERGETTNSISCIMSDTGLSEESARQHLRNLIEETWKQMNKGTMSGESPFTKPFMETAINLARIAQCQYQHGDGHGNPDTKSKNRVLSLIIDPIK
uniref:Isoprene synthase n=1 Tax=Ficus septica TaxID=100573 RepID=A0A0M4UQH9_9ROSA|nr:isoprene synthase [Ficus septica]